MGGGGLGGLFRFSLDWTGLTRAHYEMQVGTLWNRGAG